MPLWTADSTTVRADSSIYTADGGVISSAGSSSVAQLLALTDLDHWFGQDLQASNAGDTQLVSGILRGQQRVLRRLLTNPGDYIWHPEYGGGLPSFIGKPMTVGQISAVVRAQISLEAVVAKSPPAAVSVTQRAPDYSAFTVSIAYTNAASKTSVVLAFSVAN